MLLVLLEGLSEASESKVKVTKCVMPETGNSNGDPNHLQNTSMLSLS